MQRGRRPRRRTAVGQIESEEQLWTRKIWRCFADREAPIPERDVVRQLAGGRPWADARRKIQQLVQQGWLVRGTDHRLGLRRAIGTLRVSTRGFGFVVADEPPDTFVPAHAMAGAIHGDTVAVWVRDNPEGRGPEGRVMAIPTRGTKELVGALQHRGGRWVLVPSDDRLPGLQLTQPRPPLRFEDGSLARAEVTAWPEAPGEWPRGRVVDVIGRPGDPGVDVAAVMAEHQLPSRFPSAVLEACRSLPLTVGRQDMKGRVDLRDRLIVTIDGADAKDLDDAISLDVLEDGGFRVGVHIADVSHYVEEHGLIDVEALRRATSVYLVDRVIPMLPEALSNRLASLTPGEPRLAVSAWMELTERGEMRAIRFDRSVIKTRHRLTYDEVNQVLAGEPHLLGDTGPWLHTVADVAERLHRRRVERGAVDFELPEPKVLLDDQGHPTEIVARERGRAERLIEELMLLANEAVAQTLMANDLPGLYRVHEEPAGERLEDFRVLLGALGYRLPEKVAPKDLQRLLDAVRGKPEDRVVNGAMLRAMRQARYSPGSTGHFGLAAEAYTHFTSPIRRYPDLFVHRVLTQWMAGSLSESMRADWRREAPDVAQHCSERERAAMDAERASVLVKQVQFMADKLGQAFDGVVSGVQGFGVFVTLDLMVEGLIRVEDLPHDQYRADPIHQILVGERSGRRFRLGDPIRVVVARVDERARQINLTLAPEEERRPRPAAKSPARPRRVRARVPR